MQGQKFFISVQIQLKTEGIKYLVRKDTELKKRLIW